jgi:uncharacterized protein (DUF427 family)
VQWTKTTRLKIEKGVWLSVKNSTSSTPNGRIPVVWKRSVAAGSNARKPKPGLEQMWRYSGQKRPDFAQTPGPGQESVWDYPRPPVIVPDDRLVEVRHGPIRIASSNRARRVLETASPPTIYLPPQDIDWNLLRPVDGRSVCEWKGVAEYWGLKSDPAADAVGWRYPNPTAAFKKIRDYVCFYPARLDCFIDGEQVRAQVGGFYGGWVTDEIVGPFKGEPETGHW